MRLKTYLVSALITCFIAAAALAAAPEKKPEPLKKPLIHAIISDEVRDIMQKLNQLMTERGMSALDIMEIRVEYLRNLISTANELVVAAENLTDAIPGVHMQPESQITFEALAKQLQDEAVNIAMLAEATNDVGLEPVYQRMNETCAACHRLFRF